LTKVEYCTVKQKCLGRLSKKIVVRSTVRVAEGNLLLSTLWARFSTIDYLQDVLSPSSFPSSFPTAGQEAVYK